MSICHQFPDDTSRLRRAKKEMESPQKVVASEDNVQSGLSIDGSHQVDHVGRLGQLSTLTEETPQSEDVRDRNIKINECSSLLVNGFNEEENLLNDELLEYEPEPLIEVPGISLRVNVCM